MSGGTREVTEYIEEAGVALEGLGLPRMLGRIVGALLLAAFLWSLGSLYGRDADMPESSLLGTSIEMLGGAAGLFLAATFLGEWRAIDLAAISTRSPGCVRGSSTAQRKPAPSSNARLRLSRRPGHLPPHSDLPPNPTAGHSGCGPAPPRTADRDHLSVTNRVDSPGPRTDPHRPVDSLADRHHSRAV